MSKRTAEASKVITRAWNNEKQLVLQGEGIRDWTPEQQQEILDKGKAYDDGGKAFEGHHMKSVEQYPEHQGEPGNIQFLNRQEHQEAHGGNFQNPTNGYFNPVTKVTVGFGDNPFEPCEIIKLSNPIVIIEVSGEEIPKPEEEKITKDTKSETNMNGPPKANRQKTVPVKMKESDIAPKAVGIKKAFASAVDFYVRHQDIINPIIEIGGPIISGLVLNKKRSLGTHQNKSAAKVSSVKPVVSAESVKNVVDRVAPAEHIVPAHRQRYNGVWKEKAPYPRGGKK